MAIQLNAGDLVRIAVKFGHPNTSLIENVWHLIATGTGTATAENVMDAVVSIFSTIYEQIDAYQHEDTTFEGIAANIILWAVDKWINIGNLGEETTLGTWNAGQAGDCLPDAVAALVRFPSEVPKREGRKYFGPFTELASTADGKLDSGLISFLTTAANAALITDYLVADSDISLQIAVPAMDYDGYSVPSSAIIRSEWAYQRRRKSNVGL